MRGTGIENRNITSKTKCMGTNAKKWKKYFEDMYYLQKPSNSVFYTPSSEPFRIYLVGLVVRMFVIEFMFPPELLQSRREMIPCISQI
jgi:hypothetical protein